MTVAADFRLGTKPAAAVTDEVVPGLIWGVRCSGVEAAPVDDDMLEPGPGEWLWLHFNLADMRTSRWLETSPLVPKAAIERLLSKDDTQQIVPISSTCVAGVFFDLLHDFDQTIDDFGHFHFALTERVLDHRTPPRLDLDRGDPPAHRDRAPLRFTRSTCSPRSSSRSPPPST